MLSTAIPLPNRNVSLRRASRKEGAAPLGIVARLHRGSGAAASRPRKSQRGGDNAPMRAVSMTASDSTTVQPDTPHAPMPKPLENLALILQQLRLLGYL